MPVDYKAAARKRAETLRRKHAVERQAERTTMWRRCLRCRKPFASEGVHNRLCDTCRRTADIGPFDGPHSLATQR